MLIGLKADIKEGRPLGLLTFINFKIVTSLHLRAYFNTLKITVQVEEVCYLSHISL